jgi:hypothetical protein
MRLFGTEQESVKRDVRCSHLEVRGVLVHMFDMLCDAHGMDFVGNGFDVQPADTKGIPTKLAALSLTSASAAIVCVGPVCWHSRETYDYPRTLA